MSREIEQTICTLAAVPRENIKTVCVKNLTITGRMVCFFVERHCLLYRSDDEPNVLTRRTRDDWRRHWLGHSLSHEMSKPYEKEGYEEAAPVQTRRIRITLTSKDVKNLEKGARRPILTSQPRRLQIRSVRGVDRGSQEQRLAR